MYLIFLLPLFLLDCDEIVKTTAIAGFPSLSSLASGLCLSLDLKCFSLDYFCGLWVAKGAADHQEVDCTAKGRKLSATT